MRSFLLKLSDREEGPFPETQIAQMFADQRVNRLTPCKPEAGGDWKTIDDYLPILKYGTQLPPPAPPPPPPAPVQRASPPALPIPVANYNRVALVDLDIPFVSLLKMMFKWMAAAFIVFCCFLPIMIAILLLILALFGTLIGGAMSSLHQP